MILLNFNANLYKNNGNANVMSKFGTHMVNVCDDENMVIADSYILCNNYYTLVSSAHNTVSLLDHVVTTKSGCDLINNMCIKYDYVSSDHLPLMMQLGPIYELMKVTRARFKQCLRHFKIIEDKARADALSKKIL